MVESPLHVLKYQPQNDLHVVTLQAYHTYTSTQTYTTPGGRSGLEARIATPLAVPHPPLPTIGFCTSEKYAEIKTGLVAD